MVRIETGEGRKRARRNGWCWLLGLLVLMAGIQEALADSAALCRLPAPPRLAVATLSATDRAEAPRSPSGWWRLRALVPARVTLSRNEGVTLGLGEVLGTSGSGSERTSAASSAGYAVRLVWDLRPLLAPPAMPRARDPIERDLGRERLGGRIVGLYARYRALVEQAGALDAGDPVCDAVAAEAQALRAVLRSLIPSQPPQDAQRARPRATAPPPRRARPS